MCSPPPPPHARPILRLLSVALSAGVLLIIVSRVSASDLAAFRIADANALLLAAAIAPPILILKIIKWRLLLGALRVALRMSQVISSWLGGMAVSLLTPARLGELARIAYLPAGARGQAVGVVAVDRLTDVIVLAAFAVTSALLALQRPDIAAIGLGIALACALGLIALRAYAALLIRLTGSVRRIGPLVRNVLLGLTCIPVRRIVGALALGGLTSALGIIQFGLIIQSMVPPSSIDALRVSAASFPLIVLSNLVPLSINGLGIREGTSVWLTQSYGVPALVAAAAAFLSFALNTLTPGLFGAFTMLLKVLRNRD